MDQSTLQILLAEHARLGDMDKSRETRLHQAIQRYLTITTASAGIAILLLDKYDGNFSVLNLPIGIMLATLIGFGLITYNRMLADDLTRLELSKNYFRLRQKFTQLDSELADLYERPGLADSDYFAQWCSISGILKRVFSISGPKTVVATTNCFLFALFYTFLSWPMSIWAVAGSTLLLTSTFAIAHLLYARMRYHQFLQHHTRGAVTNWM